MSSSSLSTWDDRREGSGRDLPNKRAMEATAAALPVAAPQSFLQRVFGWMTAGLLLTAGVAGLIGSSDGLLTDVTDNPVLLIVIFVVEIALVVAISAFAERLSTPVVAGLFFLYAALNGVVFAFIFELYTAQSIFTAFLVTAGMFGAMAVWGYATHRDLSGMGSILFMALIGLIIATVVNAFVASSGLYWITTYAGVVIFAGLTAYDMQKLKRYGEAGGDSERTAIRGALSLYLDFINLFLYMLRLFGQARR
jgi:FtsH-binding integral membrane protein